MSDDNRLHIFTEALDNADRRTFGEARSAGYDDRLLCDHCMLAGNCGLEDVYRKSTRLTRPRCGFFLEDA